MKRITAILVLLSSHFSFAQTIATESPSFSAGATTVPKTIFQVETNLGVNISYDNLLVQTNINYVLPTTLLRYGLTNRLEVRANPTMNLSSNDYSLASMYLGLKYNIIGQKNEKFQMSVIANYGFPVAQNSVKMELNSIFTFNYDFSDKHSLGANVGYHFKDMRVITSQVYSNNIFGTLIYNYKILDNLSCFVEGKYGSEINYFTPSTANIPPSSNTFNSFYWDTGLLYQINDRMQLDYVFGMDLPYLTQFHMFGFHFMIGGKK